MISSLKIEDGPYRGKLYEEIMFEDYLWICKELEKERKKRGEGIIKTGKEIKMEQLIEKGENKTSRRKCLYCSENYAYYFSIIMGWSGQGKRVGSYCCSDSGCFDQAIIQNETMGKGKKVMSKAYPIRFSSLAVIGKRCNKEEPFFGQVIGYLRFLYNMPEKLLCQQRDYIMFFQD